MTVERRPAAARFRNYVDSLTLREIGATFVALIVLCGLAYYLLSPFGHGVQATFTDGAQPSIFDCLYFSVVTITSLGYGDYRPVGGGRLVSMFQILAGLLLVALFVGKLASETQSRQFRVLWATDQNRSLRDFLMRSTELQSVVDAPAFSALDDAAWRAEIVRLNGLVNAVHQYLAFIGENGLQLQPSQNLEALLRNLVVGAQAVEMSKAGHTKGRRVGVRIRIMRRKVKEILDVAASLSTDRIRQQCNDLAIRLEEAVQEARVSAPAPGLPAVFDEAMLEAISRALPPRPWPQGIHKNVARTLGVSNRLAWRGIAIVDARASKIDGRSPARGEVSSLASSETQPPGNDER